MSEVKIYGLDVMVTARTGTDSTVVWHGVNVLHATSIASVGPDGYYYLTLHVQRE